MMPNTFYLFSITLGAIYLIAVIGLDLAVGGRRGLHGHGRLHARRGVLGRHAQVHGGLNPSSV